MIIEIGLIAVGVPFGILLRKKENLKNNLLTAFTLIVYALLFFFGLKVGSNEDVMNNLDEIGLHSLIISLALIAGSIVSGILIKKYLKSL